MIMKKSKIVFIYKYTKTTANPIDTRQQKLNTNKVKAGNKGAPTPDEQAKLQQRIQQQLAAQA